MNALIRSSRYLLTQISREYHDADHEAVNLTSSDRFKGIQSLNI